jgi:hypothetical protein
MPSASLEPLRTRRPRPGRPSYWDAAREPLYSLVFLLPFVATYEFAALLMRVSIGSERQLVAVGVLRGVLTTFGAGDLWLPGLALLLTLLFWHLLSNGSWQIRAWAPLAMLAESLVLMPPLLAIGWLHLTAGDVARAQLPEQMVLALGAGIYEELIFRLGLTSLMLFLLIDVGRAAWWPGAMVAVVTSAALFALCHVRPVGVEDFEWLVFSRRALAGAYLSLIFLTRGLGIAVGCHSAYNLALLLL